MKKTNLFRTIIIALSFGLMILLCACGNTGTGAESSEASSKVELTAEQQVEKLLLESVSILSLLSRQKRSKSGRCVCFRIPFNFEVDFSVMICSCLL